MDVFHVVFDTSLLRRTPFGQAHFERLLRRAQQGFLKLYIPYIALEERRTQLVDEHWNYTEQVRSALNSLQRSQMAMLREGLPELDVSLPTREEVDRNSCIVLGKYLSDNKVEVLPITIDHANSAWERYFGVKLPFNAKELRENRRKDIPDSWILEAALEVKAKQGRHCVLIKDGKLEAALEEAGFELWDDVEMLDAEIERATSVILGRNAAAPAAPIPLGQLRGLAFENIDVIVLGMNEALGTPDKERLFAELERIGVDRAIAEHEAKTLVLAGVLVDAGNHLIPTNRDLARQAESEQVVQDLLLRAIS